MALVCAGGLPGNTIKCWSQPPLIFTILMYGNKAMWRGYALSVSTLVLFPDSTLEQGKGSGMLWAISWFCWIGISESWTTNRIGDMRFSYDISQCNVLLGAWYSITLIVGWVTHWQIMAAMHFWISFVWWASNQVREGFLGIHLSKKSRNSLKQWVVVSCITTVLKLL